MLPNELDQLLGEEDAIRPSPGFAAAVMEKILKESGTPPLIAFPWRLVVSGLTAAGVAMGAAAYTAVTIPNPAWLAESTLAGWLDRWATLMTAAATSPSVSGLALALLVSVVPMAAYAGFQRLPLASLSRTR